METNHEFSGKSFVLSLYPQEISIPEFWACVALVGGQLKTGVSGKLDYLIEGEDPSGKYVKGQTSKSIEARKLIAEGNSRIRILQEQEFLDLIGPDIVACVRARSA